MTTVGTAVCYLLGANLHGWIEGCSSEILG
jgi:hypothetical protein